MKHLFAALLAGTLASASANTNPSGMAAIAGLVKAFAGTNGQDAQKALSNAANIVQAFSGTNSSGGISVGPNVSPANQSPASAIAGLVQAFSGTNAGGQDAQKALAAAANIVQAFSGSNNAFADASTNASPAVAIAGLVQAFAGTNADGQNALATAAKAVQALSGASNSPLASLGGKQAIDFRELKSVLPETLAGLRRTNARGEKTSALGANISLAEGTYGADGEPQLVVKINDLGALGPAGSIAAMAATVKEVDSEGDSGYERTTQYRGYRGLEKYTSVTKSGTANIVVARRFVVEITGHGIESAQLKTAAEGIDYAALEKLANPQ